MIIVKSPVASISNSANGDIIEFATDQVVECGALLPAAHVPEEAVVGHQQQGAGVPAVVVGRPPLTPDAVLCMGQTDRQGKWGRLKRCTHGHYPSPSYLLFYYIQPLRVHTMEDK